MRYGRIPITALGIFAASLALTGCGDDGTWDTPRTPTISLTVADGCPTTVTRPRDVANTDPGDSTLLPAGSMPDAALICAYSGPLNPSDEHLAKTLNADEAQRIADALLHVSLARPRGTVSCPDDSGAFAILAFSYPHHPDVSLWWNTTGCQSIDNGRIGASQIASPSFSDFQNTFDAVAGLPDGPRLPQAP